MIAERAFAEHLATLYTAAYPGETLHVFKDDLAWHQANEPWPMLMVTKTAERVTTKGTGRYDTREWDDTDKEFVYSKLPARRIALRLTIRSAAQAGKSGATIVDQVADVVRALLRKHITGSPLDLVDTTSTAAVHLERLRSLGESDQSSLLTRVPFEAQQTLDVELWHVLVDEIQRAPKIESIPTTLN